MAKLRTVFFVIVLLPLLALADEVAPEPASVTFLAGVRSDPELQSFLDTTIETLKKSDAALRKQNIRVALIDIPASGPPSLAHWNGDSPVYPASVPKFVYLMAAYAWRDRGQLEIDPAFGRQLQAMIYKSSNRATQVVVRRITNTKAGPRLNTEDYEEFSWRRHSVNRWLENLGIRGLHMVHPTYDGGGDLHGRDVQFLEDQAVKGSLPDQKGQFRNRQAMTANATALLLALLAEDLALRPETSAEVRERMRRDPRRQSYLWKRIAGAVDPENKSYEVFAKTGTWGPIYADAGIIRHADGRQLVVAVFLEGRPAYRGSFIAKLTKAAVNRLLTTPASKASGRSSNPGPRGAARG